MGTGSVQHVTTDLNFQTNLYRNVAEYPSCSNNLSTSSIKLMQIGLKGSERTNSLYWNGSRGSPSMKKVTDVCCMLSGDESFNDPSQSSDVASP